jgi:hypothetical protein
LRDGLQSAAASTNFSATHAISARNNPSMFLLGSVAIGFGLSRFLKASYPNDGEGSPSYVTKPREVTRGARADAPRRTPSDFENERFWRIESNRRLDVQFDEVEPTPARRLGDQRERRLMSNNPKSRVARIPTMRAVPKPFLI